MGKALRDLGSDVTKRFAGQATGAGARLIRDLARRGVPVDTGALRAGIVAKKLPKSEAGVTSAHIVTVSTREMAKYAKNSRSAIYELQGPIAPRVVNGKTVRPKKMLARRDSYESLGDLFYAHFIEFGTVKMSARPFLRPAFDAGRQAALDRMTQTLRRRIEQANKGGK